VIPHHEIAAGEADRVVDDVIVSVATIASRSCVASAAKCAAMIVSISSGVMPFPS